VCRWDTILLGYTNPGNQVAVATKFSTLAPSVYCLGDTFEKNEMDGACNAYEGKERRIQGFGGET